MEGICLLDSTATRVVTTVYYRLSLTVATVAVHSLLSCTHCCYCRSVHRYCRRPFTAAVYSLLPCTPLLLPSTHHCSYRVRCSCCRRVCCYRPLTPPAVHPPLQPPLLSTHRDAEKVSGTISRCTYVSE